MQGLNTRKIIGRDQGQLVGHSGASTAFPIISVFGRFDNCTDRFQTNSIKLTSNSKKDGWVSLQHTNPKDPSTAMIHIHRWELHLGRTKLCALRVLKAVPLQAHSQRKRYTGTSSYMCKVYLDPNIRCPMKKRFAIKQRLLEPPLQAWTQPSPPPALIRPLEHPPLTDHLPKRLLLASPRLERLA